jgi:hypothetical protein
VHSDEDKFLEEGARGVVEIIVEREREDSRNRNKDDLPR